MKAALIIAVAAVSSFATCATAQEMPGGLWELKTKMEMPGMPAEMVARMGDRTTTYCVKPGERKWNEQRLQNDRVKQCEQTDLKVDGNKTSWKMNCKDGTTGEGSITHNGRDTYKTEMTMNMKGSTNVKMQSEGRRIAATCEKK